MRTWLVLAGVAVLAAWAMRPSLLPPAARECAGPMQR
ncbi:cytochrome bd-type quinol oxidase subunit 2 [Sphingomonas naasensis]|nr:cytochrome bd-type quinol oxidase subunit 2 [Sphingomonas naasensis]